MMAPLESENIPRPKFRKNSVTLGVWIAEFNRLIEKHTGGRRRTGAVRILASDCGLQYNTVLHAAAENRKCSAESALLISDNTGGQVPYLYLVTPLERRSEYDWNKRR